MPVTEPAELMVASWKWGAWFCLLVSEIKYQLFQKWLRILIANASIITGNCICVRAKSLTVGATVTKEEEGHILRNEARVLKGQNVDLSHKISKHFLSSPSLVWPCLVFSLCLSFCLSFLIFSLNVFFLSLSYSHTEEVLEGPVALWNSPGSCPSFTCQL